MNPKFFPTALMVQNLCASVVYFSGGDWKKGIYWIAAAVLTWTVTY